MTAVGTNKKVQKKSSFITKMIFLNVSNTLWCIVVKFEYILLKTEIFVARKKIINSLHFSLFLNAVMALLIMIEPRP